MSPSRDLTRALDWDHALRNASDEARKPYQHFAALWLKRWYAQINGSLL